MLLVPKPVLSTSSESSYTHTVSVVLLRVADAERRSANHDVVVVRCLPALDTLAKNESPGVD